MIETTLPLTESGIVDPFGLRAFDFSVRIPEGAEIFPDEEALTYITGCDYPESADDLLLAWEIWEHFGVAQMQQMSILDAMCGPGRLGRELLQLGASKVTFHDGHPLMVDHAHQKASAIIGPGQTIVSVLSPIDDIPQADIHDLVVSHNSTHQLGSIERLHTALAEMVRVTKPGGSVVIADYQRSGTPDFLAALEERLCWTKPEIVPLLVPTFLAAFTKEEFASVLQSIPGVESWSVTDASPPLLTEEMQKRVDQDPVKGHLMDFSPISLRVIAIKK